MAEKKLDLLQGTLDMLILKTLAASAGAMHGYAAARHIQETSNDVLRVEEGSLYPALHRLEGQGLIASEWGASESNRRAKFYRLTRQGRKRLAAEEADWERLTAAIAAVLRTA
jgi:transcriptional regulator